MNYFAFAIRNAREEFLMPLNGVNLPTPDQIRRWRVLEAADRRPDGMPDRDTLIALLKDVSSCLYVLSDPRDEPNRLCDRVDRMLVEMTGLPR